MVLVKAGLESKNADQKVQFSKMVETAMEGNLHFTEPSPPLLHIKEKREELEAVIPLAANGDRVHIAKRNTLDRELSQLLSAACRYVNSACKEDRDVALTSGFEAAKPSTRIPLVLPPFNLRVEPTTKGGEAMVRFKTHHGSRTKQIFITEGDPTAEPEWKLAVSTTRNKALIAGLDPNKYYWFRVNAVCASGVSGFSEPAKCRVAA